MSHCIQKEVKPQLKFIHRLNAKTFIFVLSYFFTELRFLHLIFIKVAEMFLLNMSYVSIILIMFLWSSTQFCKCPMARPVMPVVKLATLWVHKE